MRCRRNGVMLEGQGPFSAAVDFGASDGNGGFDQLTLWHDTDQQAVQSITDALKHQGWFECFTKGGQDWADQAIYTHKGSRVFVSMDISFWGKRRLRVIPSWRKSEARC